MCVFPYVGQSKGEKVVHVCRGKAVPLAYLKGEGSTIGLSKGCKAVPLAYLKGEGSTFDPSEGDKAIPLAYLKGVGQYLWPI